MALDFTIGCNKIQNDKLVSFPDNIRAYLNAHKSDFSSGATVLLSLDEYGDTLIYNNKMEQLLQLCIEIQKSTDERGISGKCERLGITKDELMIFSAELSQLLKFAIDNGKIVLAVGD